MGDGNSQVAALFWFVSVALIVAGGGFFLTGNSAVSGWVFAGTGLAGGLVTLFVGHDQRGFTLRAVSIPLVLGGIGSVLIVRGPYPVSGWVLVGLAGLPFFAMLAILFGVFTTDPD
jgi:hypothetical protein